jgi:dinuclear metal center YbgI/SA1388 family protein
MQRNQLIEYIDQLLDINAFSDYAPNGLQVEGRPEINKIVGGVTACQALVDRAVEEGADALLVHHGYFWKGENPCVVGMKQRRLKALLAADINLVAYHLPLDAHPELGNNAQLAKLLGLKVEGGFAGKPPIGQFGELETPMSAEAFAAHLGERLARQPLHIAGAGDEIQRVAWCTGAAQSYLEQASFLGVDAYISGEISEPTVHTARETGVHYYSAGHHATERYGVQALGSHLAERFGLDFKFCDIKNQV